MRRKTTPIHALHSDVLIEILERLNLIDIRSCRSVCKRWNQIIRSPCFTNSFSNKHKSTYNPLLLMFKSRDHLLFGIYNHNDQDARGREVTNFVEQENLGGVNPRTTTVLGTYCGLVCIKSTSDLYLCNPRTRETVTLPKPPSAAADDDIGIVVFGYVTSRMEYMLVRVSTRKEKVVAEKFWFSSCCDDDDEKKNNKKKMTSIASSCWKQVEEECPRAVHGGGGIMIHNVVYWLIFGNRNEKENELIVSLDVDKDKFGIMGRPKTNTVLNSDSITLIDLKGTLSLADAQVTYMTNVVEVWGWKGSEWVKEYSVKVDLPPRIELYRIEIHPVSSGDGELIIQTYDDCYCDHFYIFNPNKNKQTLRWWSGNITRATFMPTLDFFQECFFPLASLGRQE